MMDSLATIKRAIPPPARAALRPLYTWMQDIQWLLSPARAAALRRMQQYKDKHRGERCFIIGNGPSLRQMDLSPLRGETTFGMNRIYLLFPRVGFHTSYYVCVNRLVIEQTARDIEALPMPKFLSWHARKSLRPMEDALLLRDRGDGTLGFSLNPARRIWEGATVTYVAMQIAYYMGFQTVVLIGVDHHFSTAGEPHKKVISEGEDPNHFDPGYFGRGFQWQLPDLATSEEAYSLARRFFEEDRRTILDATVGGRLQVFPKVDYSSLF